MIDTICIAGKNNIAVYICDYLLENYSTYKIVACINKNDSGLNSFQRSFKSFCDNRQIEIVNLDSLYEIPNLLFLSLEFDKIINPSIFKSKNLFNIHFSLLPKYKGMYTSALPILYGEEKTGVTLHYIDKGIDTGDIIAQKEIHIGNMLTCESLYEKYTSNGIELIKENLESLLNGKITSKEQNLVDSTYFSKKTLDFSNIEIDLNKTAFQILRQINAFVFPAYQLPIVFSHKIYKCEILKSKSQLKPGLVIDSNDFHLIISTIDYDVKLFIDKREELFQISKNGDLGNLIVFINNGYDIFQRSKEGWDISIIAAYNQQYDFLEYLIHNLNWNTNTKNNNGTTLSMYLMTIASKLDNVSYFQLFLSNYKPNLDVNDYSFKNIYDYAKLYKNDKVIEVLKKYKND